MMVSIYQKSLKLTQNLKECYLRCLYLIQLHNRAKWCTLVESVCLMLLRAKLPKMFREEAIATAWYVRNYVRNYVQHEEKLHGRKPNASD